MVKFVIEDGAKRVEMPVEVSKEALRSFFDDYAYLKPNASKLLTQENAMANGQVVSVIHLGSAKLDAPTADMLKEQVNLFRKTEAWEIIKSTILDSAQAKMFRAAKTSEDILEGKAVTATLLLIDELFTVLGGLKTGAKKKKGI